MRIRAWAPLVLAGITCASLSTVARAAADRLVETVAGYEISRVDAPKDAYPCRMVRGYADPKDNNAANALAFGELDGMLIVSIVYERWKWPANTTVKARFSVDTTLIDAKAPFIGNATYLAIKVPISHLPAFEAGNKIILGFKDGIADFDLTGFKPAFEATKRCNRDTPAKAAEKPSERPESATRIGSGIAATQPAPVVPPAPKPPPPPAVPAVPTPAAAGPLPSEERAVAYLFGLYDRWAFDVCDMRTTAKQRNALDGKMAALKPEMGAIEADLRKQVPGDPGRCPPAAVIEKQLQLMLDNTPEDFLAMMDERTAKEFRGIVQPILARLKPAAPPASPAPIAVQKPLPSDLRIAAYLLGLTLQDVLQRCDVATTARQRSGLDAKVDALRPEMAEVEPAVRAAVEMQACPGPDDKKSETEITDAVDGYVEKSPEDFATAIDAKRDGGILRDVRKIVETVRPTPSVPAQARMSAYLWGLVLKDKIAQCDIATTARQRAGLDSRLASMKAEMSGVEAALRAQIQGQVDSCPKPEKAAEIAATITLFIESEPEVFAAELDRRAAAKPAPGTAAAPPKAAPTEPPAKDAAAP